VAIGLHIVYECVSLQTLEEVGKRQVESCRGGERGKDQREQNWHKDDTTRLRQEESQSQTEIVTHILQLPSNSTRLVYFSLGLMNMMGKRKEQCSNAVQRIKIQSLLSNNLHT